MQKIFSETRKRYVRLFGNTGDKKPIGKDQEIYCQRASDKFDEYINKLIYNCCDGKVSDIKALESSSYMDFCSILENFLEKVEYRNKEIEKSNAKLKSGK